MMVLAGSPKKKTFASQNPNIICLIVLNVLLDLFAHFWGDAPVCESLGPL